MFESGLASRAFCFALRCLAAYTVASKILITMLMDGGVRRRDVLGCSKIKYEIKILF